MGYVIAASVKLLVQENVINGGNILVVNSSAVVVKNLILRLNNEYE